MGTLARLGFQDANQAADLAEGLLCHGEPGAVQCSPLLDRIAATPDPDMCLATLQRLAVAQPTVVADLETDPGFADRVVSILGASSALGQHLVRYPEHLELLRPEPHRRSAAQHRTALLVAVGADPDVPGAATGTQDDLRLAYRKAVLVVAARDLTHPQPTEILPDIAAELADLADATVEAALALARAEVAGWEQVRFGVVALGKTGAQELNYVSDVDVLYIAEAARTDAGESVMSSDEALAVGTRLAGALTRACSAYTAVGTIWQIDAALRPEGKAGPLVRTLASHASYYGKWAKPWEFQAMLKARPMAGDLDLAAAFVECVTDGVWSVGGREHFVAETQAMRRRVISLIPPKDRDREIKLGPGGLRDVEFTAQLLQLVHGRADVRLRERGTFAALQALIDHGYVGRADGAELGDAYRFQRLLEHRLQLFRMRRTHLLPDDPAELRRLARSVGLPDAAAVTDAWRTTSRTVLRLHNRMFYSPLLEAVARIPSERVRLSADAAETWLLAIGYGDPKAALRHIEALSSGMSRPAEIQRQLLPAMLGWFAEGPNPDHGLLSFRRVSDALGRTHWYLRALRDEGAMAERMAYILASSRYAVDLMLRAPQTVSLLADAGSLGPRPEAEIRSEMQVAASRHDDPDTAIEIVRGVRRLELLRLAMGDLLGLLDHDTLGLALSELTAATLDVALEIAARGVESPAIGIVALGRWGGDEMSYSSDADAMFVIDDTDDPDALKAATDVISRMRALLSQPGRDPAFVIDPGLRPEGKGGPMVRSIGSYERYYERWSATWETQAMLRARPGAGDRELGQRLLALIEDKRFPAGGLAAKQLSEIRRLKARMEAERLPRGVDPVRHTKLGPGGLSDVEWAVQLLQLQHGHELPELRSTTTLAALHAAQDAGLVTTQDAQVLRGAWRLAGRIRNGVMLVRGRPSDVVPTDSSDLAAVAQILGYGKGRASVLMEEYARRARLARTVVRRLFWGED